MDKEKLNFSESKPQSKKTLAELDAMISGRQRGRVVDGKVIPLEQRMKELQAEAAEHGGVLPPNKEDELRRIEFELKGPKLERYRNE